MAEYLSEGNRQVAVHAWCAVSIFLFAPLASAEILNDPTRPPASLDAPVRQESGARDAGPVLQSVLISPTRKVAIINGETVRLGEKFGDARVVKIAEDEVVLRNGNDLQVLKLFPQVEKKQGARRSSADPDRGRQ